ncbi:MAG: hypothetical protein NC339_08790 [Muribaculaceae bacterium]|nr:hypothetical protein [Muribaculaceae bacterium]
MDDNNLPDDSRQSLYEEFIAEVVKAGNPEAYFDENDLVEIFDYSSDMDNYIAKMEVLLYGARHYPDSQPLATRRAWFYSSFGELDAAAELNSRVSNGGVLNELLKLRAGDLDDTPRVREELNRIVAETTDFADEELIQLVDFCAEIDMFDWIAENYDLVKSKCSYPQTFIYEYANRCEDTGNYAKAVALFEELTMLEPFTLDFWERLARVQYEAESYKSAIASADYALAISPQSDDARRVKALSLYSLQEDMDTIISLLEPLVDSPKGIDTDLSVYVGAMASNGRLDDATMRVMQFAESHPQSRTAMGILLTISPDDALPYIKRYRAENGDNRGSLYQWAVEEFREGKTDLSARLACVAADTDAPDVKDSILCTEILYSASYYKQAVSFCEMALRMHQSILLLYPQFIFPYTMSLIRMGRREDAAEIVTKAFDNYKAQMGKGAPLLPLTPDVSPTEYHVMCRGYHDLLKKLKEDLTDSKLRIDPYTYYPTI